MALFTASEIRRNLLGGLEAALFMNSARTRFGDTADDAIRSFIVPILFYPVTLLAVYTQPGAAGVSLNTLALLYSLRMVMGWALFLGGVYFIASNIDRKQHFCRFVTAVNWLTVPATAIFLPAFWMLMSGGQTWETLYPFMTCLVFYSYAFTAFIAARVLCIPWELAGFIAVLAMMVDDYTGQMVNFFL